jgi:Fur family transcriptional regulator, peroxide stress response regulator
MPDSPRLAPLSRISPDPISPNLTSVSTEIAPAMIPKEAIVQRLKGKGLRITPQRFAVYANLLHRDDHPTADQILQDLNGDAPRSSQATVYSALQALQEVGLIREVLLESGVCRYDANVDPHHHFRCRVCGTIVDLPWDSFTPIDLSQLVAPVTADAYEVIVQGHCDRCCQSLAV